MISCTEVVKTMILFVITCVYTHLHTISAKRRKTDMSQVYILLPAGTTIRQAAGAAGYTTPIKVAEAVVQAVEYEPWLWMGWDV